MDRFLEIDDAILEKLGGHADRGAEAVPIPIGRGGRPEAVFLTIPVLEMAAAQIASVQGRSLDLQQLPVQDLTGRPPETFASLVASLAEQKLMAAPVLVEWGAGRCGAVISVPLFGKIYHEIDRVQPLHIAAERLGSDAADGLSDGELEAMCADFGVNPENVRRLLADEDAPPLVSDEPPWRGE